MPQLKTEQAVTLWIPGLLDYQRIKEINSLGDSLKNLRLPALQTLFAKADVLAVNKQSDCDQASYLFHQRLPKAYASIMAAAEITDYDVAAFWVRVDPVQMIADRDTLVLIPGVDVGITELESKALIKAFNNHFVEDKVELEYASTTRWYLRIKQPVDIQTHSLSSVEYKSVDECYPQGHAGTYWRQLMNETQMLFYTHSVNEIRREQGLPEINSVWIWGEGVLDKASLVKRINACVSTKNIFLRGLSQLTDSALELEPESYQTWLNRLITHNQNSKNSTLNQHLIRLDSITDSLVAMQAEEWIETLKQLERDWFAPLLNALQAKQLTSLLLDFGDDKRYHLKPSHLNRFWRFKKLLSV